jgi:hypothetical protein
MIDDLDEYPLLFNPHLPPPRPFKEKRTNVARCGTSRLIQQSGTCWFNAALNSLFLVPSLRCLLFKVYSDLPMDRKTKVGLIDITTQCPAPKDADKALSLHVLIHDLLVDGVKYTQERTNIIEPMTRQVSEKYAKDTTNGGHPIEAVAHVCSTLFNQNRVSSDFAIVVPTGHPPGTPLKENTPFVYTFDNYELNQSKNKPKFIIYVSQFITYTTDKSGLVTGRIEFEKSLSNDLFGDEYTLESAVPKVRLSIHNTDHVIAAFKCDDKYYVFDSNGRSVIETDWRQFEPTGMEEYVAALNKQIMDEDLKLNDTMQKTYANMTRIYDYNKKNNIPGIKPLNHVIKPHIPVTGKFLGFAYAIYVRKDILDKFDKVTIDGGLYYEIAKNSADGTTVVTNDGGLSFKTIASVNEYANPKPPWNPTPKSTEYVPSNDLQPNPPQRLIEIASLKNVTPVSENAEGTKAVETSGIGVTPPRGTPPPTRPRDNDTPFTPINLRPITSPPPPSGTPPPPPRIVSVNNTPLSGNADDTKVEAIPRGILPHIDSLKNTTVSKFKDGTCDFTTVSIRQCIESLWPKEDLDRYGNRDTLFVTESEQWNERVKVAVIQYYLALLYANYGVDYTVKFASPFEPVKLDGVLRTSLQKAGVTLKNDQKSVAMGDVVLQLWSTKIGEQQKDCPGCAWPSSP